MYPDFLGIGAQKAGTSWLHSVLSAQESIWLPPLKEIHYFDRKFPVVAANSDQIKMRAQNTQRGFRKRLGRIDGQKLISYLQSLSFSQVRWEMRYYLGHRNDEWYSSLFRAGGNRLTGDITPAYSRLDDNAVRYVHNLLPEAKIIFLLRNPVDRAWSHAVMDLAKSRNRPVEDISQEEFLQHFNSTASVLRGSYSATIKRWRHHYQESRLFIGFFDHINNSPEQLIKSILSFLGVSQSTNMAGDTLSKRVNAGVGGRIPAKYRILLSQQYLPELETLASMCGCQAQLWLESAQNELV